MNGASKSFILCCFPSFTGTISFHRQTVSQVGPRSYQSLHCPTWQSPSRHRRYLVKKKQKKTTILKGFSFKNRDHLIGIVNVAVIVTETNQSRIGSSSSSRSARRSAARPSLSLRIYRISFWGLRPSELHRLDWPSGTFHGRRRHPRRRRKPKKWRQFSHFESGFV